MKKKINIILLSVILSSFVLAAPVSAADDNGFLPECQDITQNEADRECTVDDFLVLAVNLINFMLGIAGSLALLFFILGGFIWLFSQGSSDKIEKGRQYITNAIIGLFIVLASWMIVNFIYTTMVERGANLTDEKGKEVQKVEEWWKAGTQGEEKKP